MYWNTDTERCSKPPVLEVSPVVQALLVLQALPVVQVCFGVVHLGRKLQQVRIWVPSGVVQATAIFREHLA